MKRRQFLKIGLLSPLVFHPEVLSQSKYKVHFEKGSAKAFDYLFVKGSYREIGYQVGRYFRKHIQKVLTVRKAWFSRLLITLDAPGGKTYSAELKRLTRKHFPQYLEELEALALGAGMDFKAIWALTIKSELGALEPEEPGCSTIYYSGKGNKWLFHNEDGNDAYRDQMFVVHIQPPSEVSFISLVYPGILTGNGPSLNSFGIVQTTNYISTTHPVVGIPRYVLGRAILEARSLEEAVQIATMEPRTHPYHHNLISLKAQKYISLETTPQKTDSVTPEGIYFHTNHLILKKTRSYPYEQPEYKQSSSLSRYRVIEEEVARLDTGSDLSPRIFFNILSSHQNAPYSPCRHPRGEVQGRTLATAFVDLNQGVFRLYRGNPCVSVKKRHFTEYGF